MAEKVILILADGMRPDGLLQCGHPYVQTLMAEASYSLTAQTVMPSVTLPCHMSLFHSVDPDRHGTTTNTYAPQVRPIEGLFDRLYANGKKCALFYSWEPLRDLSRPGHLHHSLLMKVRAYEHVDRPLTDAAIDYIRAEDPDFLFLYLAETDEFGHDCGWMSETYLQTIHNAVQCVQDIVDAFGGDHTILFTADHGGHARTHGTEEPEDMTIPLFCRGSAFPQGERFDGGSILDIAVTVAKLLEISNAPEWEGKALF